MRKYPSAGSYIDKAERAISATGNVVIDMRDFPSIDEAPAHVCIDRVKDCDVYVGIYGTRWGSPVRDRPDVSYTELEFDTATATKGTEHEIQRLVFQLDPEAEDPGIPPKALIDRLYGDRQEEFLAKVSNAGLTLQKFSNPDQLSQLVERSLKQLAEVSTPGGPKGYTTSEIAAWLERYHCKVERAFLAIPSVQQRRVHVPLDVRLTLAGADASSTQALLEPEQLAPLLEPGSAQLLLISGDGGCGKTSLAFRIARWFLEGKPDGLRRLPLLIETGLAEGESVAGRVKRWLDAQLADEDKGIDPALVAALLRQKRLIPILDHVSELSEAERQRLLTNLPAGLVIATTRSNDDGYRERPITRLVPLQIATDRLQSFFLDYLRQQGQGELLKDDDLVPAQNQLRRIVGDKPITALLAQMFIDDVIAKRKQGVLAGSVPDLMLSYVTRVDTPSDHRMRQRAGLVIDGSLVQRVLKVLALASHRQGPRGKPMFQPLVFPLWLAERALAAADGLGLAQGEKRRAILAYLLELRLLLHPGADASELRFPLDSLSDYLAALEQLEQLEAKSGVEGEVWEEFLAQLEDSNEDGRERMRGFLLALRDCCHERSKGRSLAMPTDAPDRLGRLAFLDPEEERYRQELQRARKWTWELGVPVASERRDAVAKLAAMSATDAPLPARRAVREVASERLALAMTDKQLPTQERAEVAMVLGLIGNEMAIAGLMNMMRGNSHPLALRRAAAEGLGLLAAGRKGNEESQQMITKELAILLRKEPLKSVVKEVGDWNQPDATLPLLQGAARGLQLASAPSLPILGTGVGHLVPMLTLMAKQNGEELDLSSQVVEIPVWKLPLPDGEQVEMVIVPGGNYEIGSPADEKERGRYDHAAECTGIDVEARQFVQLTDYAMARFPISQAQWAAVAKLEAIELELSDSISTFEPKGLWECYCQPGGLPVESVTWFDCQEWLARLNRWLAKEMVFQRASSQPLVMSLPSESLWEVA
ncbi:DUF4062 domain-containing protein [Synechococcus sp. Tobar12-5m-g]|nr:DUF4062 domain-containing protein [Synechococcus sp. Tobar12-5m-g]MCP9874863.1 DUF4062 domain-containing protein [Synechococcus sp. Cruz CV-v-12]